MFVNTVKEIKTQLVLISHVGLMMSKTTVKKVTLKEGRESSMMQNSKVSLQIKDT